MKKIVVIIVLILFLFSIFINKEKKLIINYEYNKKDIIIKQYNNSKEAVFLFKDNFLIYREKYGDTLSTNNYRNGKREFNHLPSDRSKDVFEDYKIRNISEEHRLRVHLAIKKLDPILYKYYDSEKTPFLYLIGSGKEVVINYKIKKPIEKGKYKIFLNMRAHDFIKKTAKNPRDFTFLNCNEIEDNPLEFEVK